MHVSGGMKGQKHNRIEWREWLYDTAFIPLQRWTCTNARPRTHLCDDDVGHKAHRDDIHKAEPIPHHLPANCDATCSIRCDSVWLTWYLYPWDLAPSSKAGPCSLRRDRRLPSDSLVWSRPEYLGGGAKKRWPKGHKYLSRVENPQGLQRWHKCYEEYGHFKELQYYVVSIPISETANIFYTNMWYPY